MYETPGPSCSSLRSARLIAGQDSGATKTAPDPSEDVAPPAKPAAAGGAMLTAAIAATAILRRRTLGRAVISRPTFAQSPI
ncbi:MAG: hypothetical protein DLM65_07435 [Candidatus Aeolococcus gillhamiae]|uniref:Uncharacterized protein n=1 Tax=Candidatus Aeolococcus gillhamiae TaxID=3127015 RepID=A0A2W5Z5Z3_9BACT|nr:MAG: hypothetical protein DLM65_07435 [Candidatus Dormibacter sp. RRmetagenome_bin12]